MVLALDELTVGILRRTFTFYMQDAYGVQLPPPACDTDLAGSSTIVLVGANPTIAQLRRLLGARRATVQYILAYLLDKDNVLVGEHKLARQALQSPENLESYDEDGRVPKGSPCRYHRCQRFNRIVSEAKGQPMPTATVRRRLR